MRNRFLAVAGLAPFFLLLTSCGSSEPTIDELVDRALTASSAEAKEKAAVKLASHGTAAVPQMRKVLAETDTPQVKAAMIQGLGHAYDYDSIEEIFKGLEHSDRVVRLRAAHAVSKLLGRRYGFNPASSAQQRQRVIKSMRADWEGMKGTRLLEDWKRRVKAKQAAGERI